MPFNAMYREEAPTRDDVDQMRGLVLLEFGAEWCGYCQELSPTVEALLTANPQVQHVRVADGRGKRLGRSFRVKLWPTFVFIHDGEVIVQLVRPSDDEIYEGFARLLATKPTSA